MKFEIEEFEALDDYDVAEYVRAHDFSLTKERRQISQAQRNALRDKLIKMAYQIFAEEYEIEGVQTSDGYMLEVQSDQLGVVVVELALKIKNLDYDIFEAMDDFYRK